MENLKDKVLYVPIQINGSVTKSAPPYQLFDRELFLGKDGSLFVGIADPIEGVKNIGVNTLTSNQADQADIAQAIGFSTVPGAYSMLCEVSDGELPAGGIHMIFDFTKYIQLMGPCRLTGKFSVPSFVATPSSSGISYFNIATIASKEDTEDFILAGPYSKYAKSSAEPFDVILNADKPCFMVGFANASGSFILDDLILTSADTPQSGNVDIMEMIENQQIDNFANNPGDITLSYTNLYIHCKATEIIIEKRSESTPGMFKASYVPSVRTKIGSSLWGPELPGNGQDGQLFFLVQQ